MTQAPNPPEIGSAEPTLWNAILLAGDRPGGDPLAQHFGLPSKALVPLAGKVLAAHGLATLTAHPRIGCVFVMAQEPDRLFAHPDLAAFQDHPKVQALVSTGGISTSVAQALRGHPDRLPMLVTTADHVLLDHAMIDWVIDHAAPSDVAVGLVTRRTIEAESFDTRRTWLRFADEDVTGANLFALTGPRALAAVDYWQQMEAHRKKPWRLAWGLGPVLLLKVLLRRLTVAQAIGALGRKIGVAAAPVLIPYARAGVDVDKVADHELVTRLLEQQAG